MDRTDVDATIKGHEELFICYLLTLSFTLNFMAVSCVVWASEERTCRRKIHSGKLFITGLVFKRGSWKSAACGPTTA